MSLASLISTVVLWLYAGQSVPTKVKFYIPDSDAIDYARVVARDEGFDVSKTKIYTFDVLKNADGTHFPREGYTAIGFNANLQPQNLFAIFNATGQVIDFNSCDVFDYPNLKSFQ